MLPEILGIALVKGGGPGADIALVPGIRLKSLLELVLILHTRQHPEAILVHVGLRALKGYTAVQVTCTYSYLS